MRLFDLDRIEDETGISGTGIVAQGVMFDDGTCALRWLTKFTSAAFYDSKDDVEAIHGHGGKTRLVWRDEANHFDRGRSDCAQDGCENAPFASVGGLDARESLVAPTYIEGEYQRQEYLRGYEYQARRSYGDDWRTCAFGWAPALTIDAPATEP